MSVLVTLLHLNKIYHAELQDKMTVTFGNHKKDSVMISEMNASQISVELLWTQSYQCLLKHRIAPKDRS